MLAGARPLASAPVPARARFRVRVTTGTFAVVTGILLFASSDAIYPTLMKGPSEWVLEAPGLDSMRRLVWLFIYTGFLALIAVMAPKVPAALKNQHWLALAMGYFLLSALWADHTSDSLVGGVQATFTMVCALILGVRLGSAGIVRAFQIFGLLAAGSSLVFVVLLPDYAFGYRYNAGALRGVYVEKNHLALILSYAFWASATLWFARPKSPVNAVLTLVLAVLCVMAKSSIALLSIALVCATYGYFLVFERTRRRGLMALILMVSALVFLAITLPVVLSILGEDMTFNGRTILWGHLWDAISQHPIFGHGYRGYWDTAAAQAMRDSLGWPAHGAHNVWVQTLLFGGAVGFVLWSMQWVAILGWAGRVYGRDHDRMRVGIAVLVFMSFLWSMFETTQMLHFSHNAIITGLVFAVRSPAFR